VNKKGNWYVRESIGTVHDTQLKMWLLRGRKTDFSVHRLKDEYKKLIPDFISETEKYLGLEYDIHYNFDNKRIYCSELMYNAWNDLNQKNENIDLGKLGVVKKLGEMNWEPYEKLIREIEYGRLPLKREMITPRHLSEAEQLEQVVTTY